MFGFKQKSMYGEAHYADFIKAMREARAWTLESPESNSRHSLAVFFAVMADTFEMDSPKFDRDRVARACGFFREN